MKLVIVDDEKRIVESAKTEISLGFPDDQFEIVTFTNPKEALQFISNNHQSIFLVITDMRMPALNGVFLLKEINSINSDIQTILLTGYSDIEDIRKAVSTSIQSLIMKPWQQDELYSEITKAKEIWLLKKENIKLKKEMDFQLQMAGDFQKTLFPDGTVQIGKTRIDALYLPLETIGCGGDYLETIKLENDSFCLLLGDTAGHGIQPALISVMVKTIVQQLNLNNKNLFRDPPKLLGCINEQLLHLMNDSSFLFISMMVLYYDSNNNELHLSNAGQPPLFHILKDKIEEENTDNMVLGIDNKENIIEKIIKIDRGNRIVIMSDGIIEDNKKQYRVETEICKKILKETTKLSSKEIANKFIDKMPSGKLTDDATMVVLDF